MNLGIMLPGFSANEDDWALPVQANLARHLAQNNHLRIIALRYPHRRDHYQAFGAEVHSIGVGQVRGWRRLALWLDALRLIRRLHRERPFSVLHAMWADETGLLAVWAGRLLKIPVVVSILGGELVGLPEYGYGLQLSRFGRWTVGQALKADRVIVPSRYVEALIQRAGYQVPAERRYRGVLGVDITHFTPSQSPTPRPRHLITVASLIPIKGHSVLLHALACLPADITLDIIGHGTDHAALEQLAIDLGIHHRVRFLGEVYHLDLPQHYQAAALMVLASYHEVLAIATLEAAACGVPVVSSAVGTLPDYPTLGLTVPAGDTDALAQAIQALLDDPTRHQALAYSARQTIETEFDSAKVAAQLQGLYQSLNKA